MKRSFGDVVWLQTDLGPRKAMVIKDHGDDLDLAVDGRREACVPAYLVTSSAPLKDRVHLVPFERNRPAHVHGDSEAYWCRDAATSGE